MGIIHIKRTGHDPEPLPKSTTLDEIVDDPTISAIFVLTNRSYCMLQIHDSHLDLRDPDQRRKETLHLVSSKG